MAQRIIDIELSCANCSKDLTNEEYNSCRECKNENQYNLCYTCFNSETINHPHQNFFSDMKNGYCQTKMMAFLNGRKK